MVSIPGPPVPVADAKRILPASHDGPPVNDFRATLAAPLIRGLERLLPVPLLLALLYPVAWLRSLVHRSWKGSHDPVGRPPCLTKNGHFRPPLLDRLPVYLNRTFEFFPDRLAHPKWKNRCRISGLEPVQAACKAGRGVILAFAHFGAYGLLRNWLRAYGVPLAMYVGGRREGRSRLMQRKDRWALNPDVPLTYYRTQLAEAVAHLRAGLPLGIAVDATTGRQIEIPLDDGWRLRLATGAMRLARNYKALLFPVSIRTERPWRFVVEIGPPIPEEAIGRGDEAAGAELLEHFLPTWRQYPEHGTRELVDRFIPPDCGRLVMDAA